MTKIPLDLNVVEVPEEVKRSLLAFSIREECSRLRIRRPIELNAFFEGVDVDAGHVWMRELLKSTAEMSAQRLIEWVAELPPSQYRIDMNAELNRRVKETGEVVHWPIKETDSQT